MRNYAALLTLGLAVLVSGSTAKADTHCDIPGEAFSTEKLGSAEECGAACQANAQCKQWVYVSGWGQCSLKSGHAKPRSLRIWAAKIGEKAQSATDHSGKDFKKISHVPTPDACLRHCGDTPGCVAMAYIDGYQDCYLKNTPGQYRSKVFSCGTRSLAAGKSSPGNAP